MTDDGPGAASPGTRIGRAGPDVGQHRLARQLRDLAWTARRTRVIPARLRRAWHPILRVRAHA